jgi:hypothetical protein
VRRGRRVTEYLPSLATEGRPAAMFSHSAGGRPSRAIWSGSKLAEDGRTKLSNTLQELGGSCPANWSAAARIGGRRGGGLL